MPKKTTDYPEQINFLAREGTLEKLIAIAYFRGEAGIYAGPTRDFVQAGIRQWTESLTTNDRKRFESILKTVAEAQTMKKTVRKAALPNRAD